MEGCLGQKIDVNVIKAAHRTSIFLKEIVSQYSKIFWIWKIIKYKNLVNVLRFCSINLYSYTVFGLEVTFLKLLEMIEK